MAENISYHNELGALCDSLGLKHITCRNLITSLSVPRDTDVLFLPSIPGRWKTCLLRAASLLLYTPGNEHFGIVPLEALAAEVWTRTGTLVERVTHLPADSSRCWRPIPAARWKPSTRA